MVGKGFIGFVEDDGVGLVEWIFEVMGGYGGLGER